MTKVAAIFGFLILGIYSIAILYGLKVNWYSDSIPYGIYMTVEETPKIGKLAATCLNEEIAQFGLERGYFVKGECETGIQAVVKPITAMEGDRVSVSPEGISINGQLLPDYPIYKFDSQGRALVRITKDQYILKGGEYWLMSNYKPNSFDSRYWGPVKIRYIIKSIIGLSASLQLIDESVFPALDGTLASTVYAKSIITIKTRRIIQ